MLRPDFRPALRRLNSVSAGGWSVLYQIFFLAQWGAAAKAKNGGGVVKQTSQRSLLFRQNVGRTEAEWSAVLNGIPGFVITFR